MLTAWREVSPSQQRLYSAPHSQGEAVAWHRVGGGGVKKKKRSWDLTTSCRARGLDGNVVRPFVSQSHFAGGVSGVNLRLGPRRNLVNV